MKFSLRRDEIYEALQKVVSVIPQRSTIPMTQNVLLLAEGEQIELVSTDLEITMVSRVNADIEQEGSLAIPGRLLFDIIRELPNVVLTFESQKPFRLILNSEFGQYKMSCENPADFPRKPQLQDLKEFVLPNEILRRLINKTIFACSTDELRPALTGVYIEIGDQKLRMVGTDGHRLSMISYQDEVFSEKINAIISTRALNFVLRSVESEGMSAMLLGDQHALFHMENNQLYARLIEERYVDYNQVLPSETNFEMLIDPQLFLSSVKRVSLFSNPITAQVFLKIQADRLSIQAEDIDCGGEAQEEIPCQFNGEDIYMGFNSKYLQDILKHVDSPQLKFQLIRADFAALFRPVDSPDQEDQVMLLMPIRLKNQ